MDIYNRQKKLKLKTDQSVAIIGCGGIGYWVAKFLAMSGIEKIYAFDPDVWDVTNMNRIDISDRFIGENKASTVKQIINVLRPDCSIYSMPFEFTESHDIKTDWLIDCTDKLEAQKANQKYAKSRGIKYFKAGYDGNSFGLHNTVAEWGEAPDGYQVIPSWVAPAVLVATLAVSKVMKYPDAEIATNIKNLFQ